MPFKSYALCKRVLFVAASALMFSTTFAIILAMLSNLGLWPTTHPHFSALVALGEGFCLGTILGLVSSIYILLRKSHLIKPYLIASSVFVGCVFSLSFIAVNFFGVSW